MNYKFEIEDIHVERMVMYVSSNSESKAQSRFELFSLGMPKETEIIKEYYQYTRLKLLRVLDSEDFMKYVDLASNLSDKRLMIVPMRRFLEAEANGDIYNAWQNDISEFYWYWEKDLSDSLMSFQLLSKIDSWYVSFNKEKSESIEPLNESNFEIRSKYNYYCLKPGFNFTELVDLFCGEEKNAFIFLNLLYEHKMIDEKCEWCTSPKAYGAILGIIHAFRANNKLPVKINVLTNILSPIRHMLKAGKGKLNADSKIYHEFFEKANRIINIKEPLKLKAIS